MNAGDEETAKKIENSFDYILLKSKYGRLKEPKEPIEINKQQQKEPLNIDKFEEVGKTRIYISNDKNQVKFAQFKNGVYTSGKQKVNAFIENNIDRLKRLGLTKSEINVMTAIGENCANLDSINTWDNSFVTFGMLQWTIGAGNAPGGLPVLLKKIKQADAKVFHKYYGKYGLDIVDTDEIGGYFKLNGNKLVTPEEKELLRNYQWAFYFWLSGQDPLVQSIEIKHALSRIKTFYRSNSYKIKDYYISDLVTSEYGVALILDNHVNRPVSLKPCLEQALEKSGLSNPKKWGTEEERKFIDAYLKIRETYGKYPMTHAAKRAAVTNKYLKNRTISDKHGSFHQK